MRKRITVHVRFFMDVKEDESYDKTAAAARKYLMDHVETIPMVYEEHWECPQCGYMNSGVVCTHCLRARGPADLIKGAWPPPARKP